ncbi:MAG: YaaL family protein [Firmicutes bacterium]|nr:YaaL family protein [Bacillota bacterium]
MKGLSIILTELSQKLLGEKGDFNSEENSNREEFRAKNADLIERAKQDWHAALSLFNNIEDPGLIDHAIYNLNAAERRYVFLLEEARRERELNRLSKEEEAPGDV